MGFVKSDVAFELMGFLLEFLEEKGLVGLEFLLDDSFVLVEETVDLLVFRAVLELLERGGFVH